MSRPDYSALGGTISLTDLTLTGSGGNADLKPIKAAVFDAALEWYYAPQAVAAVSVFYDDLSSYVSYGVTKGNLRRPDADGQQRSAGVRDLQHLAAHQHLGRAEGIELQVQQPIGKGFGFQANATYITGTKPAARRWSAPPSGRPMWSVTTRAAC